MRRIISVDVMRIFAIISVIAIHVQPFETTSTPIGTKIDIGTLINQLSRFAVPFFFVISGYFWSSKFTDSGQATGSTTKPLGRIGLVFLAWSIIYMIDENIHKFYIHNNAESTKEIYWQYLYAIKSTFLSIATDPIKTIFEGTRVHLWFLMALMQVMVISAVMLRLWRKSYLVFLSITLYIIGLAGKAYSDTPVGFHVDFNFRDGPFFALIFFVTGHFLQTSKIRNNWLSYGLLLALSGIALHLFELVILHNLFGTTMKQDFVIGTYLYGVGMAMISLSNTSLLYFTKLASIAPMVLGIYASHFLFLDMLAPIAKNHPGNHILDVIYIALVFSTSLMATFILSKHRLTRIIVM